MWDRGKIFERQFLATDGGYIHYPWARSGGKLVTEAEFEALVARWQHATAFWPIFGYLLVALFAIVGLAIATNGATPIWAMSGLTLLFVLPILLRVLPASLAPWRLVRDRPDVTAPRSLGDAFRQQRALLPWWLILLWLVWGALELAAFWTDGPASWWRIGPGLVMFVIGLTQMGLKLRDRLAGAR